MYMARQRDLDRTVALKELSSFRAASSPVFAQRFIREARLAGLLSHPNIVTVHEYFEDGGVPYIAMEYLSRGSLRPWVGRLSLAQLAGVLEGMLAGLAHAERKGVIHRDMKPENIMVTAEGQVKITDFGISKAIESGTTGTFVTATGMAIGTPIYMAPEQALAEDVGPWTDLYSVGVMTYEQIAGRAPFRGSDAPMVILMRHVNEAIPALREVVPDVDPALSDWVTRLLIKDPARRTRSAAEAWEELEEIVLQLLGPRWRRVARLPERPPPQREEVAQEHPPSRRDGDEPVGVDPAATPPAGGPAAQDPTALHPTASLLLRHAPGAPRKRRTGMIAAVVIAAVTVAGIALAVLSSGGANGGTRGRPRQTNSPPRWSIATSWRSSTTMPRRPARS